MRFDRNRRVSLSDSLPSLDDWDMRFDRNVRVAVAEWQSHFNRKEYWSADQTSESSHDN